jgi:Asp/Glu/hydantoin racemase
MKILLANVPAVKEHSESGKFVKEVLVPLWRKNLNMVKRQDTEITFRFPEKGIIIEAFADCKYLPSLNLEALFDAVVQAEKDGFDAAMLTCFSDHRLWEIREVVNIPVVSIGESSMLMAAMMGLKFGVVTISQFSIHGTQETIAKYGFSTRSVAPLAIEEMGAEQEMAITDARHTIECFKKVARKLIANGADKLIPGCGLMSPALRLAPGVEKVYPQGLTEVDGVPVADVMSDTLLMAEALVTLKKSGAKWINRKGYHSRKVAEHSLNSDFGIFWDC